MHFFSRRTIQWLVLAACLWAFPVSAQQEVETPLLTVLGKTYTASELGLASDADRLQKLRIVSDKINEAIFWPVWEQEEFQVSEEELKDFCRRQTPTAEELGTSLPLTNLFEMTWADWQGEGKEAKEARMFAESQIAGWKVQKSFFDRYGGRVAMGPMGIPQAYDAVRIMIKEQEAAGQFIIHDEALRVAYWERFRMTPKEPLLSEEEGRAAFAEDPAERWKKQLLEMPQRMEE